LETLLMFLLSNAYSYARMEVFVTQSDMAILEEAVGDVRRL
jgi:hypothetical protein